MTAAHCVYDEKNANDMYVRVGDHDNSVDGDTEYAETFKVESFIYHKKYKKQKLEKNIKLFIHRYDPDTTNNDIALLKLSKKIDFSKYDGTVTPVCLPQAPKKYYGKQVWSVFWVVLFCTKQLILLGDSRRLGTAE